MSVETGNGWIASVPPEHATGTLAEAYQSQFEKIGRVTELTRIGSLYPDLVAARLRLYAVVDATPSDVPDHVRRAVALLTSVLNGCLFCTAGHTEKLTAAGYAGLAQAIKADPEGVTTGDAKADAAISYARKLVTDSTAHRRGGRGRAARRGLERPRHPRHQQHHRVLLLHQPGGGRPRPAR